MLDRQRQIVDGDDAAAVEVASDMDQFDEGGMETGGSHPAFPQIDDQSGDRASGPDPSSLRATTGLPS